MRTKEDEEKTRAQVEEIVRYITGNAVNLTSWEQDLIERERKWIEATKKPFWTVPQAAKIEQIWKARVK